MENIQDLLTLIKEDSYFNNKENQALIFNNMKKTLESLIDQNLEFQITVNKNNIKFSNIDKELFDSMPTIILLDISNYSKDTVMIDNEILYFNAAFGEDPIETEIEIKIEDLMQIKRAYLLDIAINIVAILGLKTLLNNKKVDIPDIQKSKNVFLNNPNNKKFK